MRPVFRVGVFVVPWMAAVMWVVADRLDDQTSARLRVKPMGRLAARPFALERVRLLDGPFKAAQHRDLAYLLRVEPDRLLAGFRKEAGLEPKAPSYGGWESEGLAGHSLGHYLSACSMAYAITGNERFSARVRYIVSQLAECQQAHGDGYLAAIPGGKPALERLARGEIESKGFSLNGLWSPWYTIHKQLAGLIDAWRYCGDQQALAIACRLADWIHRLTADLTAQQWQQMLACEYGGINESLVELYAITGQTRYLTLSQRFHDLAVLGPLAEGRDPLPGRHANTQIPKLTGAARRYEIAGYQPDRRIAEFFWETVVSHHTYVTGGNSEKEYFGPPDKLNDRLSHKTTETCNTYNMLKLTRHLFAWRPSVHYMDYYERALYNHILASQDPESGGVCYFVPLAAGCAKRYSTPLDDFTCCHGTGMENHLRYNETIYFHDDRGLYVNLFIPSELNWPERGLKLRMTTAFPEQSRVRLELECGRPERLAVRIRSPGWAHQAPVLRVNGRQVQAGARPGTFASVERTWHSGDVIEMELPMKVRLEAMPDNPRRVAFFYGPVLLAGDLGPEEAPAGEEKLQEEGPSPGQPPALAVPVLHPGEKPVEEWLETLSLRPLRFRTAGIARPADVSLRPFYEMHHRRYIVYWDIGEDQRSE